MDFNSSEGKYEVDRLIKQGVGEPLRKALGIKQEPTIAGAFGFKAALELVAAVSFQLVTRLPAKELAEWVKYRAVERRRVQTS